jgi:hypothetical protein
MGRVVAIFQLSVSLTCFSQTNTPQNTTTIPAHVNLEPAPPVQYGTASSTNVVSQPPGTVGEANYGTPFVPAGPPPSVVVPSTAPTNAVVGLPADVNMNGVSYATEAAPSAAPSVGVADAAARYRTSKAGMKSRVIDNNTLSTLDKNPSGLVTANEMTMPQSDVSPEEAAALRNAKPTHAAADETLDPRDLAAVEAAVRRGENGQDIAEPNNSASENQAGAQSGQVSGDAAPNAVPAQGQNQNRATGAANQQEPQAPRNDERERLPESSSALPLLALLGFIALSGGAVSVLRARA